jgi:acyl carrier protein phosphodiesterase
MNYLAHAYLSFGHEAVLTGNLVSDFVKGKQRLAYPPDIFRGIMLHRDIDTFTDAHPVTKAACRLFKPVAGPYAAVFMDVVYDHFLARDKTRFANQEELAAYAQEVYRVLYSREEVLPEKFRELLPYMQRQDWLTGYYDTAGIANSFKGIFRRARYISYTEEVLAVFIDQYTQLEEYYHSFFPELQVFAQEQLENA